MYTWHTGALHPVVSVLLYYTSMLLRLTSIPFVQQYASLPLLATSTMRVQPSALVCVHPVCPLHAHFGILLDNTPVILATPTIFEQWLLWLLVNSAHDPLAVLEEFEDVHYKYVCARLPHWD